MTEQELENIYLQHGTVKRKSDLLNRTGISPVKMASAVKKFGEPIPSKLQDADSYAADLFDFLLEFDPTFYNNFPEFDLMFDVQRYVCGEIWHIKHQNRSIIDHRCSVALDLRKCLKDAMAGIAQVAGHMLKHAQREELDTLTKDTLRIMFIEAAEEATEEAFGRPLQNIKLLN